MGDPTFLPANQEMKKSQTNKDKKQMQQETKTDQMKKNPKKKTKGDLWANPFSTHYAKNIDILRV